MVKRYAAIIIGAGPAGMTAATYLSRANLSVLMLDQGIYGGQMNNTAEIENYPGFDTIMGPDLSEKMYASSMQFGAEYAYGSVQKIEDKGQYKIITTDMDDVYEANAVIIATGSEHSHLGVLGEEEYQGKGVSYCAVCDGAFFKDEDVIVVGGGDSAVEEGLYLANLVKSVTIIHRREKLKAQAILQQRAFATENINFVWNSEVQEIMGDGESVTGVKLKNTLTNEESEMKTAGVFIYIGLKANSKAFSSLGITDEKGWIQTNELMETKVPGIFAIGDVRAKNMRQITTAVGDGGVVGQTAYNYLMELEES